MGDLVTGTNFQTVRVPMPCDERRGQIIVLLTCGGVTVCVIGYPPFCVTVDGRLIGVLFD